MYKSSLNDISLELIGTKSFDELKCKLGKLARGFGCSGYGYQLARNSSAVSVAQTHLFITDYPDEWIRKYSREKYYLIDPIVQRALGRRKSFAWNGKLGFEKLTAKQTRMLKEAAQFGIKQGVTVPIHGPNFEFSLFTVISNDGSITADESENDLNIVAQIIGHNTHALILEHLLPGKDADEVRLTKRETEVLNWVALGKTSWEISRITGLSEATINFHIRRIFTKLRVTNRCQAVAKATVCSLIDPTEHFAARQSGSDQ